MSLKFYLGAGGSGKSSRLYRDIIEKSLQYPKTKYLIVVPDQFTMQTQKDICLLHPAKGIMNIDVLSFGRLSHRIFEELGKENKTVLDDTGKNLILRKVAQEKESELKILNGQLKKTGYIHEIKSAISEFMQYGIGLDDMDRLIAFAKQKGSLSYKLMDLKILYKGFLERIAERYITAEESLVLLKQMLVQSELVRDSVIAFDGFTGFTPVQNEVIREIMHLAKEVIITLTMDKPGKWYEAGEEQSLFHLSEKTLQNLEAIALKDGIERKREADICILEKPVIRYRENKELAHLEEQLFRYQGKEFEEPCNNIKINELQNLESEVKSVCIEMCRLVREEGYKYQEIAVITGDLTAYSHKMKRELELYGIPYFMDQNRGILLNPFIEYIKSALETVLKGYTYETVFHFLRSGMTGISREDIDELENYVLACGIKGKKKWKERFFRKAPGMEDDFTDALELINQTRETVIGILSPFEAKGKTARELSVIVYEFIVAAQMQEKLAAYEKLFQQENKLSMAKEYGQIYHFVVDLLDQIAELLNDEKLTLQEYAEILYAGFDELQVGIIPQNVDQVVIGDMERTRLKEIKALFFVGINDGIIPKNSGTGGIISDMEREFLKESEYELAPSPREQMYRQRLYLYMIMSKPKEYLYLSYAKINTEGKSQRSSYLIKTVCKIFPKLTVEKRKSEGFLQTLATPKDGRDYLAEMMREYAEGSIQKESEFLTLYAWYQNHSEYEKEISQMRGAAFYHYESSVLSKAIANAMYGKLLENSVSRLEQYAACAYSHFLKYGLGLFPREEFSFERVDMGNVFHGVLELFSDKLAKSQYTWFDFPKEEGEKLLQEALEAYAAEYGETILYSSARNEYLIQHMKRILNRSIHTLQYQLKKGVFQPKHFELSFSFLEDLDAISISLSKEEKMRLRGRIDRVDTYEDGENIYVKVIDYKSGNVSFDLVSLYHGLQLQLVVYMNAALEMEKKKHPDKNISPAAILYYHMEDPMITTEGSEVSEEEVNNAIKEKLRMNGIINAKREIVEKLDASMTNKSDVIPIEYKKDGCFSAASSVMTEENLKEISSYVNDKMKEIGRGILAGNMEKNPYELGNKNACTYCNYKAVCGFDTKIEGYQSRKLDALTKEEALEKIMERKKTE